MKKLILAAAVIVFASFTSYTKNKDSKFSNPAKAESVSSEGNKVVLGYAYNSRLDIGQADGNN